MRWMWLKNMSDASCSGLVTFRGRFYAVFLDGDIIGIDPYSRKATPLVQACFLFHQGMMSFSWLRKSSLVPVYYILADTWATSAARLKELPDGCGVSGDSVVFTDEPGNATYSYKYGVDTGRAEDDLNFWRYSRENLHARSVCSSWRSAFPLPCSLVRPRYSLPRFNEDTLENEGFCSLKKIPLFPWFFLTEALWVIDPYSLNVTLLMPPSPHPDRLCQYLVSIWQ
ncbi:unnamed protein product [Microthlaspi erraticum]|uniref:DUF295 domain-containing protein n=1 Tax=Microthlaspi erraticum TaxID=1685480 RepID=A0A6D2K3W2_9BRAS|nr:unnamed protein product [Microthlaspi erraticum]